MISVKFKRPPGFNTLGKKYDREIRENVLNKLITGLRGMQESILETPVYTGRALINYQWSLGNPQKSERSAIKEPALPGRTSDKAIGREPRRRANAAVVREEFSSLVRELRSSKNPFQKIFLTNNTPYFLELEYGSYAKAEGKSSRTPPGGMVRRGEALLQAAIPNLRKTGGN